MTITAVIDMSDNAYGTSCSGKRNDMARVRGIDLLRTA